MIKSNKVILTLDAGGTNFSFAAIKNAAIIGEPLVFAINPNSLDSCLDIILKGFYTLIEDYNLSPSAISFSFPGPADYKNGIIMNAGNLPAFSSAVALGPFLENTFKIPVYINNDGDLFTYGQAKFGLINESRYSSLVGITLGSGVGGGFYNNGSILHGETSNALEVWTTRNGVDTESFAEEGLGKRAITNFYADRALSAFDIYNIAIGEVAGNKEKAINAYIKYGKVLGELLSDLLTLFDAPIVLGGGISKAYDLFLPAMLETINGKILSMDGSEKPRIVQKACFIKSKEELETLENNIFSKTMIPRSKQEIIYRKEKILPIFIGDIDTNKATQLGAYAYAINQLENKGILDE